MKNARWTLALFLTWGMACLPLTAQPAAMITPLAGQVTLNGQSVISGAAVMPGDVVAVGLKGGARMVLPHAAVLAGAQARFRLASRVNGLRLSYGVVRVSGSLPVLVRHISIAPAGQSGIYTVSRMQRNVLYIVANHGALQVTSSGKTFTIASGKAARMAMGGGAGMGGGGRTVPYPVAVAIIAVPAIVTGVITHHATVCSGCIVSASY